MCTSNESIITKTKDIVIDVISKNGLVSPVYFDENKDNHPFPIETPSHLVQRVLNMFVNVTMDRARYLEIEEIINNSVLEQLREFRSNNPDYDENSAMKEAIKTY